MLRLRLMLSEDGIGKPKQKIVLLYSAASTKIEEMYTRRQWMKKTTKSEKNTFICMYIIYSYKYYIRIYEPTKEGLLAALGRRGTKCKEWSSLVQHSMHLIIYIQARLGVIAIWSPNDRIIAINRSLLKYGQHIVIGQLLRNPWIKFDHRLWSHLP